VNPAAAGPLISVVIPTFNSEAVLGAALESLAAQRGRDFEVVLSDGASTDATVPLAQSFAARLPALSVDSRPDQGVYDAINRGIARARGQWVLILGSDDRLHAADTFEIVAPLLRASTAALVHGDVRMMAPNPSRTGVGGRYAGPMTLERLVVENLCQQSIFYLRFRLHADWEFNLRVALGRPIQWVDVIVADYAATGMSSKQVDAVFAEEMPEMIRRELAARPRDRALWPLHGRLLRQGDALRRRGRWGAALRQWATYVRLRLARGRAGPGAGD
jgi:glycosyltransferase involved in cell wall biosynthesis